MQRRSFIRLSTLGAVGFCIPSLADASQTLLGAAPSVTVNPRNHTVTVDGQVIGGFGFIPGRFNGPSSVAVGRDHFAIVDQGNYRVQVFTRTGTLHAVFGSYGDGDGQFLHLAGIAIDARGDIFVADTLRHRVTRHTSRGDLVAIAALVDRPHALIVNTRGHVQARRKGSTTLHRVA